MPYLILGTEVRSAELQKVCLPNTRAFFYSSQWQPSNCREYLVGMVRAFN